MSEVWLFTRNTWRECLRRRVFFVVPIVTLIFFALYALGNYYAFRFVDSGRGGPPGVLDARAFAGASLLGLSMFMTLFLGSVLAALLTLGTVRGDAEQGLLQPVVVRPLGRAAIVLGRFLGAASVTGLYVFVLYMGAVVITYLYGDWRPGRVLVPGLHLAGGTAVVAALSIVGATLLATITNGIAVFMLYGTGLLGGFLGQLGPVLGSPGLEDLGIAISWALPFEALYQAALASLTETTSGLTRVVVQLGPLGGARPGGFPLWAWAGGYVIAALAISVSVFARRDL